MIREMRTVIPFASTVFPEPEWKTQVERWYQLDAPSMMLCESYWRNRKDWAHPQLVLLNSPQSSFSTDQLFCKTQSPSKFVHTLPSVRTSALFQLMNWRGPAISFIESMEKTMAYGKELVEKDRYQHVWVIQVLETPELQVEWVVLKSEGESL